jgi:hypothetical protein
MKIKSLIAIAGMMLAVFMQAQQPKRIIDAEGGEPDDRASARVLYWNQKVNAAAGQFAFNYGRPVWKKVYEDPAKFNAMTNGKVYRLGSNFWTNLVTDIPLNISGKDIAPGIYYLGLDRSADGSRWSLAFIDPAPVIAAHLDAFQISRAKVEFLVPVNTEKAGKLADKLTMTLSYPKEDIKNVTLEIAWGNLALSAPIKATVPE